MKSQTIIPQSRSRHASAEMTAACSAVGGRGSECGVRSARPSSKGLRPIHSQRTARLPALFRMAWILSSDAAASGRQTCGLQRSSQSCASDGAVLDERLAVAVCAAAGELPVERVQDLAVDPAQRHAADQRSDVVAYEPLVAVERRLLDAEHLQVPVEHLVDRRAGARVALLVDLDKQPRARLLGFLRRSWTRRDDLRQVVALARDGVDPGVHADTQRAARQGPISPRAALALRAAMEPR